MRHAFLPLVAIAVSACGGSDPASGSTPANPDDCDPIAETGCPAGQKCTMLTTGTAPMLTARTTCVPDGGATTTCTTFDGAIGAYDDCASGSFCLAGECAAICSVTPDSCGSNAFCSSFADLFTDREGVGLCQATCAPLAPSCPGGEACYLAAPSGTAQCAPTAGTPLAQGEPCNYLNECRVGYACALPDGGPSGRACAYYCNTTGVAPACDDPIGPGAGFACAPIDAFWPDINQPDTLGLCVNCSDYPGLFGCP